MSYFNDIKSRLTNAKAAITTEGNKGGDMLLSRKKIELRGGYDKDGNDISPVYSSAYAEWKVQLPTYRVQRIGIPDLYVSGRFYRSFIAESPRPFEFNVTIQSGPEYAMSVMERYGEPNNITEAGKNAISEQIYIRIAAQWNKIWS